MSGTVLLPNAAAIRATFIDRMYLFAEGVIIRLDNVEAHSCAISHRKPKKLLSCSPLAIGILSAIFRLLDFLDVVEHHRLFGSMRTYTLPAACPRGRLPQPNRSRSRRHCASSSSPNVLPTKKTSSRSHGEAPRHTYRWSSYMSPCRSLSSARAHASATAPGMRGRPHRNLTSFRGDINRDFGIVDFSDECSRTGFRAIRPSTSRMANSMVASGSPRAMPLCKFMPKNRP